MHICRENRERSLFGKVVSARRLATPLAHTGDVRIGDKSSGHNALNAPLTLRPDASIRRNSGWRKTLVLWCYRAIDRASESGDRMTQSSVTTRFTLLARIAAITTLSFSCAYAGTVAADPLKVAIVLAGNITDRSFNQSGYEGVIQARDALKIDVAYSEKVPQPDQAQALADYARRGYDVVIGYGGEFQDSVDRVAKRNSKTQFLVVNGTKSGGNVSTLAFDMKDMGYVIGYIGGKTSLSGVGGFVGAQKIKAYSDLNDGFVEGFKAARPQGQVLSAWTNDWDDLAKGKEAALNLIGQKADVVFPTMDNAVLGSLQAVRQENKQGFGIYYDALSDWPDNLLQSAVLDMRGALLTVLTQAQSSSLGGKSYVYGFETPKAFRLGSYGKAVSEQTRTDAAALIETIKELSIDSPRQALSDGIGMIHQHFMLVDNLSVLENVVLGLPGGLRLKLTDHRRKLIELSAQVGLNVDPDRLIWQLPIGMRQRVEILKALYRDVEVLILDEPTSVLAPTEIDAFLQILDNLRSMGKTMLFITHKLDEVFRVCDRVTVLRRGNVVGHAQVSESTPQEISRLMVGRELAQPVELPMVVQGPVVLKVRALSANNDRGIQALNSVSFEIRAGEVLGIVGVDGNGQAELADTIAGMRHAQSGEVYMRGQSMLGHDVASRRKRFRVGYVPEDRHSTGLVLDFTLWENAMLRDHRRSPFSRFALLKTKRAREITKDWCSRYDVRMHSVDQQVRFLSGGNQQKLIFAREVECDPDLLIVMQPCKGLDVGAIEAVQGVVREQRQAGKAVLYISTELEEVMAISDRIGVMCAGHLTGVLNRADATADLIGSLMTSTASQEVLS
eukprot:gene12739-15569_t